MKIHLSVPDSPYFVRRYEDRPDKSILTLNHEDYSHSVMLHQDFLLPLKAVQSVDDLSAELLTQWAERTPQILLVGTGRTQIFFNAETLLKFKGFIQRQIGIETMSTASAARTYNILAQEGRDVMAIFLMQPSIRT